MHNFLILFFLIIFSSLVNAIDVNDPAKSCSALLEGQKTTLNLHEYRGKVIYLDFWATWCPPCKKSMPFLNTLQNELKDQGFEVIAISVDEDSEDARKFLQQFPVDYIIAMDESGECPQEYGVKAMPSAYIIDRKGKVRYIHLGFLERDKNEIRLRVMGLLAEDKVSQEGKL